MIGLDTNVLVRFLTADDPAQFAAVRDLVDGHRDEPAAFYVDDLILVETYWVLARRYALERSDILAALDALATNLSYAFDDRNRLRAAIRLARERGADVDVHAARPVGIDGRAGRALGGEDGHAGTGRAGQQACSDRDPKSMSCG